MKKSLLAFAVLSTFAAAASAADTSVTLYGVVDVGTSVFSHAAAGDSHKLAVDSGGLATSRWGVKGTEDLGDGLSARFVLESGINADTGVAGKTTPTQTLFDRRATVGLVGSFGSIDLGRQTNLEYDALSQVDPSNFTYSSTNPNQAFSSFDNATYFGAYGSNGAGAAESRQNNSVKYVSTTNGGFTLGLQRSFGEVAGNQKLSSYNGVSFSYKDGSFLVVGALSLLKDVTGGNLSAASIGAKYTVDAVTLKTTFARSNADSIHRQLQTFGAGFDYAYSPAITLTGAYYNTQQSDAVSAKAAQYIAIAKYAFSKRTYVYAAYDYASAGSTAANDRNLALGLVGTGNSTGTRTTVGINHAF